MRTNNSRLLPFLEPPLLERIVTPNGDLCTAHPSPPAHFAPLHLHVPRPNTRFSQSSRLWPGIPDVRRVPTAPNRAPPCLAYNSGQRSHLRLTIHRLLGGVDLVQENRFVCISLSSAKMEQQLGRHASSDTAPYGLILRRPSLTLTRHPRRTASYASRHPGILSLEAAIQPQPLGC